MDEDGEVRGDKGIKEERKEIFGAAGIASGAKICEAYQQLVASVETPERALQLALHPLGAPPSSNRASFPHFPRESSLSRLASATLSPSLPLSPPLSFARTPRSSRALARSSASGASRSIRWTVPDFSPRRERATVGRPRGVTTTPEPRVADVACTALSAEFTKRNLISETYNAYRDLPATETPRSIDKDPKRAKVKKKKSLGTKKSCFVARIDARDLSKYRRDYVARRFLRRTLRRRSVHAVDIAALL